MLGFSDLSVPFVSMRRSLLAPFPAPAWPVGIVLVPFASEHALAAHALLVAAYAQGGGSVPERFVPWWDAVSSDEEFDPALCFVAMAEDGAMAGFALCWTSAFIKDFAVHSFVRRQGVGEALLRTAFRAFKQRGAETVALKVREGNVAAQSLYRRVGFREG